MVALTKLLKIKIVIYICHHHSAGFAEIKLSLAVEKIPVHQLRIFVVDDELGADETVPVVHDDRLLQLVEAVVVVQLVAPLAVDAFLADLHRLVADAALGGVGGRLLEASLRYHVVHLLPHHVEVDVLVDEVVARVYEAEHVVAEHEAGKVLVVKVFDARSVGKLAAGVLFSFRLDYFEVGKADVDDGEELLDVVQPVLVEQPERVENERALLFQFRHHQDERLVLELHRNEHDLLVFNLLFEHRSQPLFVFFAANAAQYVLHEQGVGVAARNKLALAVALEKAVENAIAHETGLKVGALHSQYLQLALFQLVFQSFYLQQRHFGDVLVVVVAVDHRFAQHFVGGDLGYGVGALLGEHVLIVQEIFLRCRQHVIRLADAHLQLAQLLFRHLVALIAEAVEYVVVHRLYLQYLKIL